jgi:hypothetical protein
MAEEVESPETLAESPLAEKAPAVRFTPEETAKRIVTLKDKAGLPWDPSAAKEMSLAKLKRDIPKLVYEAMWISVNILLHEHLRSRDPKKKKAACSEFIAKLSDPAFIKNLALLKEEGKQEKGKDEDTKAEWK